MNFKKRFLGALPEVPSGIDLGLGEFVTYDKSTLAVLERDSSDFLNEVGMPVCASPFLNFNSYSSHEISELYESGVLTESYYPIGSNGSGDILAIDIKSNEIVYFNHDCDNERVFINSSLDKLTQCGLMKFSLKWKAANKLFKSDSARVAFLLCVRFGG